MRSAGVTTLHAQLHAIPVELDFMRPAGGVRRPIHQLAQLRRNKCRHRAKRRRARRFGIPLQDTERFVVAVALPHGVRSDSICGKHEGGRRFACAAFDLTHRPAGGDRAIEIEQRLRGAGTRRPIAVLDQQPVAALAAEAIGLQPHQDPTPFKTLAGQGKFEVAALQGIFGSLAPLGSPVTPVPQLHRAAAILPLGYGPLEVAIVERMILDLDRQPLVGGIDGRPPGHRPGLEHSAEFEAQIIVQMAGRMFLDHETQAIRGCDDQSPAGLSGLAEVALFEVALEVGGGFGA